MFYTSSPVDRADHLRKDDNALQALWDRDDAQIVPVWQGKSLVSSAEANTPMQALFLTPNNAPKEGQRVFLGLYEDRPYFALDVSDVAEGDTPALVSTATDASNKPYAAEFADLRFAGPQLSADEGAILAYARGLIFWNSNTNFCTRCGGVMHSQNGGHVRRCTNEACAYLAFPRTDPAVIMLVTYTPDNGDTPLCLLGRSPNFPEGVYSTLAGFVEPGESLESAVQREVLEEVSVQTTDVRYVASQPWPFPRSIMLGFEAIATTTDISCDPDEIADAQWFTREQLLTFGNWGDEAQGNKLPRPDSIARVLIDRWISEHS